MKTTIALLFLLTSGFSSAQIANDGNLDKAQDSNFTNSRTQTVTAGGQRPIISDPQGPEARLKYLFQSRDGILQGLDNLARKTCFSARIGWSERIIQLREQMVNVKKGRTVSKVLPISEFKKKGVQLVLPVNLSLEKFQREKIRNRRIDKFMEDIPKIQPREKASREIPEGERFANHYYRKVNCLEGNGIYNACVILANKDTKDKRLKKARKKLEKVQKGKFIELFDGNRACAVYAEKIRYMEVLNKVQIEIMNTINAIDKEKDQDDFDGLYEE